jgi:hypothetical protein
MNHVTNLLFTLPLGMDRLNREYFFCDAQKDNLLSGFNMNKSTHSQREPGLLVRHKTQWKEWRYVKMEDMASFMNSLDDSHPCERFLKQRLLVEFPQHQMHIRRGAGFFLANESDWFQGYQQTELWLQQFNDVGSGASTSVEKNAEDEKKYITDMIRKIEVAYARTADTRLTVHSAVVSNDIDDDNHEYAYKGLHGLDWSTLTLKESKRMSDLKRRHKRSKVLELSMEFHPMKGWLRQTESFERIRQIGAATIASRVHSEPHLLDQLRLYNGRSRYIISGAHSRFLLGLKKRKESKKEGMVYERMVTPASVPHMVPSTVLCSHRMVKLKTELLNVVALLPQERLEFVMATQSVKASAPAADVKSYAEEIKTTSTIAVAEVSVAAASVSTPTSTLESVAATSQKCDIPPVEDVAETLCPVNEQSVDEQSSKKRGREESETVTEGLGDHPSAKRMASSDHDPEPMSVGADCDVSVVADVNKQHDEINSTSESMEVVATEMSDCSSSTPIIENSVVAVSVSDYVELVQKCVSSSDLFLLVVMLEQASGLDSGNPVMLSTCRIEQKNDDNVDLKSVSVDKTIHLLICHVARRLYTLDRSLRYEEIERVNTSLNGAVEGAVKVTSAVSFRPRIDFLPKCIHTTLCFRPMCHYHKCMAFNPQTEHVANPNAPGFNPRTIFPTSDSIPPRYGMDLQTSNIMLSVNSSGQLLSGWTQHITNSGQTKKITTSTDTSEDAENPDNWRTLGENEMVKEDQNNNAVVDYSNYGIPVDEPVVEKQVEFTEQRLHVSVVTPFVPSMDDIGESQWV